MVTEVVHITDQTSLPYSNVKAEPLRCPRAHKLLAYRVMNARYICTVCSKSVQPASFVCGCHECHPSYNICVSCYLLLSASLIAPALQLSADADVIMKCEECPAMLFVETIEASQCCSDCCSTFLVDAIMIACDDCGIFTCVPCLLRRARNN